MNALFIAALSLVSAADVPNPADALGGLTGALGGLGGAGGAAGGLGEILNIPVSIIEQVAKELGIEVNNLIHLLQGLGGHNDRQHTLVERAESNSTATASASASGSSTNAAVMQGAVGGSVLVGLAAMLL